MLNFANVLRRISAWSRRNVRLTGASDHAHTTIAGILSEQPDLWAQAVRAAEAGPAILIATNVPAFEHVSSVEAAIAIALTLRGARVHLLFCDAVLPACLRAQAETVADPTAFTDYRLPEIICRNCRATGEMYFGPLGLPTHWIGALVTAAELNEARELAGSLEMSGIRDWKLNGLAVGEHAYAGCLRYFARGDLSDILHAETVLRRYLEASILTVFATRRLVETVTFSSSCFHHGIYVPQGLVGAVLRDVGVPVVNWNPAYRQNTFIFSHGDSYHHTMMTEPVTLWDQLPWRPEMAHDIDAYLKSRWRGTRDWIWFHENPNEDFDDFSKALGLDRNKPVIGMLTNVMWDAQLHFPTNAFAGMLDWIVKTIDYFSRRPDVQLLIRVHPAEIRGTTASKQPVVEEIAKVYPILPPNIFIVGPESQISTYAAMERCDSVIIYGTKTGVELAARGIPVIVGGEAWIRNKGLTRDASSPAEYFALLDQLPVGHRMDAAAVERAKKYAYHFFFRRMIPLTFLAAQKGKIYTLRVPGLDTLAPGGDPGLDLVCWGILTGSPFVYEAERFGLHDAEPAPDTRPSGGIESDEAVRRYIAGGRLPWSSGYGPYKYRQILATLDNPQLMARFRTGTTLPPGFGDRLDERIVEYPWALAHLDADAQIIIDAGSVFNKDVFIDRRELTHRQLIIYTLATDWITYRSRVSYIFGDFRDMLLRNACVDAIVCISTLEHVGMGQDFKLYDASRHAPDQDLRGYEGALAEFRRILKPGGQLLITVPFGRKENHGWLQQFDAAGVEALCMAFGGVLEGSQYFLYSTNGWQAVNKEACAEARYFNVHAAKGQFDADYAAAARAVACLALRKPKIG